MTALLRVSRKWGVFTYIRLILFYFLGVLGLGALLIGLLSGLVGAGVFAIMIASDPTSQQEATFNGGIFMLGFLIGALQFSVVSQVITSGTVATYVCLAEDPEALRRTKPQLYDQVLASYQHITLFNAV